MNWQDYRIRGDHATKLKSLCSDRGNNKNALFKNYYDMYIVAAMVGVLNGKKATPINESTDSANVPGAVMNDHYEDSEFVYRLVLLADEDSDLSSEQLIDRAFKMDDDKTAVQENLKVLHSYVLGGIDYIYDHFKNNLNNEREFLNDAYSFALKIASEEQIKKLGEINN